MNKIKIVISLVVFLSIQLTGHSQSQDLEIHEDWRLRKDDDGIEVFTRWIEAEENRKARQMLAQMEVKASIDDVIDVIKDDKTAKKWVNRAKEFYHFDFADEHNWYTYTELSVPWPFSNKDLVTRNRLEYAPEEHKATVVITGVPDHIPEKNSTSRIPHFEGSWEITQLDPQTVKVAYFIFTKQEPILPRFIIDPIVENGIWSTLEKMRDQIRDTERSIARNTDTYRDGEKIATK